MRAMGYGLVSAAALAAGLAHGASAQVEVTESTSDPIETATADNGAPADVTINSGVTVEPDTGTALTINSSNQVTNSGLLQVQDADGAIGALLLGGNTGGFTNAASISILEDFTPDDLDGDGDLDTPDGVSGSGRAQGSGRVGILVEGDTPFVGDVTNTGVITVEGNNSAGVRLDGDLTGSYLSSVTTSTTDDEGNITTTRDDGQITVIGDNSFGVDVQGDVTGDVTVDIVSVRGENTVGVQTTGDIGGALLIEGGATSTGFRETVRRSREDDRALLDADDLTEGGSAVAVGGDVGGGFEITGFRGDETDEDGDGFFDNVAPTGSATTYGEAPAVLISTEINPETDSIVIGETADGYGFINRGAVRGRGINDDVDATAILIEGSSASETVTIEGGIAAGPASEISAQVFSSDATALEIGPHVSAERLYNEGSMFAQIQTVDRETAPDGDPRPQAVVIDIDATSSLTSLVNDGGINATVFGFVEFNDIEDDSDDEVIGEGDAFAIRDASGTLTSIENAGTISAVSADQSGLTVAFDGSAATSDIVFNQLRRATEVIDNTSEDDPDAEPTYAVRQQPQTQGDVYFGSGNDQLTVTAGNITGDTIAFGDGADQLTINAGTFVDNEGVTTDEDVLVAGAITDTDGDLAIDLIDGQLQFTNTGAINITSLSVGGEGELILEVDARQADEVANALLIASEAVSFEDGAQLRSNVSGIVTNEIVVALVSADTLTVEGDAAALLSPDTSFLYEASLATNPTDANTLVLTLQRRSAAELGIDSVEAAAYEPLVQAAAQDEEFGTVLSAASNETEFLGIYSQFLPDYSDATLQFAIAMQDISTGAVGNRLNAVREGRDAAGSVWIQEAITYIDREAAVGNPGYRGYTIGFAGGVDRPLGPFYALGVNFMASSSQFESPDGFDEPLIYNSFGGGIYAASKAGPLLLDINAGAGFNTYESVRVLRSQDVIEGTDFFRVARADWNGTFTSGSARLSAPFQVGRLTVTPAISADYVRLDEDSFEESGAEGANLLREDRFLELGSATATLDFGAKFVDRRRNAFWSPQLRVGFREELFSTTGLTIAQFVSSDPFVLDVMQMEGSGLVAGFSLTAGSEFTSFSLNYDADIRDDLARHTGSATFRLEF